MFLYIEKEKTGQYEPLEYAFIKLPGLYRKGELPLEEGVVLAFKDYRFDTKEGSVLADDLFCQWSCWDNINGMDTTMFSQIIYELQISYVNYKNEYKIDTVMLSRKCDTLDDVNGNVILEINNSFGLLLDDKRECYYIDSLNS